MHNKKTFKKLKLILFNKIGYKGYKNNIYNKITKHFNTTTLKKSYKIKSRKNNLIEESKF